MESWKTFRPFLLCSFALITALEHRKAVISPAVLQRLREANGYTQQAFSRAVRTSRSHYSQSETGEKHLDWNETLWKSG